MQQSQSGPSLAEAEDLTLFADEEFDTDEIDLFEFTGEENSPLTNLKTIILSLDWEISDTILQDLANELAKLSHLWQGDKVAQVYLQGMDKIGRYIRGEGAYAHPNAIKLLLTYFYDFEKIISSPNISGDEITNLLKSDVRKFKVLQYQLSKNKTAIPAQEAAPAGTDESQTEPAAPPADQPLSTVEPLKAAVLEIDWEVTNRGLDKLHEEIQTTRKSCIENKTALVLLNGLEALGNYIREKKSHSHPEAFTLLHDYTNGLESLLDKTDLEQQAKKDLVVDLISRLNALKALIVAPAGPQAPSADLLVDELMLGEAASAANKADGEAESADAEKQDSVNMNVLVSEEEAAGFLLTEHDAEPGEEEASPSAEKPAGPADEPYAPALSDHEPVEKEEELGFDISDQIDAHVENFFAGEKAVTSLIKPAEQSDIEELPPDAITPVTDEVADDFIGAELSIAPSIASAQRIEEASSEEESLDFFMDADEMEEPSITPSSSPDEATDMLTIGREIPGDEMEEEDLPSFAADEEPVPALAGAVIPSPAQQLMQVDASTSSGIEARLDHLFTNEEEPGTSGQGLSLLFEEMEDVLPALSDAGETEDFQAATTETSIPGPHHSEINDKLDSFFTALDEPEDEEIQEAGEEVPVPLENLPDSTLGEALEGAGEDGGFNAEQVLAGLDDTTTTAMEEKLDSFFAGDDFAGGPAQTTDWEPTPAGAEAPSDLDARLDAFFGETEAPAPGVLDAGMLSGDSGTEPVEDTTEELAAFLGLLKAAPVSATLSKGISVVKALQAQQVSGEHAILLHLFQSVLSTASRVSTDLPAETISLLSRLTEIISSPQPEQNALLTAVSAYTGWQEHLVGQLLTSHSAILAVGENSESPLSAIQQLRETMLEEFKTLRQKIR